MKRKSILFCLLGALLLSVLFISCPDPSSAGGVKLVNATFRISNLPYGSQGLFVYARANVKGKNYDYPIATVTSDAADAVIEKTIKLPMIYNELTLIFFNENVTEVFYKDLEKQTGKGSKYFDIDGYYYWHPNYDHRRGYLPAISKGNIENADFNKTYSFNIADKPYRLFKMSGLNNSEIGVTGNITKSVTVYSASTFDDLALYKDKFTDYQTSFENTGSEAYVLFVSPTIANDIGVEVTFTNISFAEENGISFESYDIKVLASDGKLYVTGKTPKESSNSYWNFLYCIDPATGVRSQVANFYSRIWCVEELDRGTLYIATYDKKVHKYNLSTGVVSDFVSGLTIYAEAMVNYKDNKFVMTGVAGTNDYSGKFIVIDKTSGEKTEYAPPHMGMGISREIYYSLEDDLFIGKNNSGSPQYVKYLKISNGTIITSNTSGSTVADIASPIKIFKTSPLQILGSDGKVHTIKEENNNFQWSYEGVLGRSYTDCYIAGNYIYYLNTNKETIVEKCSLSAPDTVISQQSFEGKTGIKFLYNDNKLYLLSSSSKSLTGRYGCLVYLDQITF